MTTLPMCSSILVKNTEGFILHGRNIDFNFPEYMSKVSKLIKI